ncbi:MAG: hypothetical protein JSW23_07335, partial [Planctomycetota bacterium]
KNGGGEVRVWEVSLDIGRKTGVGFGIKCLIVRKLRKKFVKYIKKWLTKFHRVLKSGSSLVNIEQMGD